MVGTTASGAVLNYTDPSGLCPAGMRRKESCGSGDMEICEVDPNFSGPGKPTCATAECAAGLTPAPLQKIDP